jgi:hypothetical protein
MVLINLDDERYARLVAALTNVQPSPVTGMVTENEIKIALGEHGDIWPKGDEKELHRAE